MFCQGRASEHCPREVPRLRHQRQGLRRGPPHRNQQGSNGGPCCLAALRRGDNKSYMFGSSTHNTHATMDPSERPTGINKAAMVDHVVSQLYAGVITSLVLVIRKYDLSLYVESSGENRNQQGSNGGPRCLAALRGGNNASYI